MLWVRISIRARCTTLCDKVYQWLAAGRWFSPGPPFSSIKQNWPPDITEILLEVAINTIKQTYIYVCVCALYLFFWRTTNSGAAQGFAHSRYATGWHQILVQFVHVLLNLFFLCVCVVFRWSFYLVRLRIMVSDYPFGILKLFFYKTVLYADMTSSLLLFL